MKILSYIGGAIAAFLTVGLMIAFAGPAAAVPFDVGKALTSQNIDSHDLLAGLSADTVNVDLLHSSNDSIFLAVRLLPDPDEGGGVPVPDDEPDSGAMRLAIYDYSILTGPEDYENDDNVFIV